MTVAPHPAPEGEVWLDVGDRFAPRVVDQHGGDTTVWSSAKLIVKRYRDLVLGPLAGRNDVVVVLHARPDTDAICAAWLTEALLRTEALPGPCAAFSRFSPPARG